MLMPFLNTIYVNAYILTTKNMPITDITPKIDKWVPVII